MARHLGIDHGRKRLGLAVSDADGRMATPLMQLDATGHARGDVELLRAVIDDYDVDIIVVGLPLNMDGSEGPQAQLARRYAAALSQGLGLPVELWDERLSSHAADQLLNQREELTNRKRRARRNALAAQTILQGYLDHQRHDER